VMTNTSSRLASYVTPLALAVAAFGCAGTTARDAATAVRVVVELDRDEYSLGEAVIARVRVENQGSKQLVVPRLNHAGTDFICSEKETHNRRYVEPVYDGTLESVPRQAAPGESVSRPFVFTRLTENAGEYGFLASIKQVVVDEELLPHSVFSEPVMFRVTDEVAFERDPASGLILERELVRVASEAVVGDVLAVRTLVLEPRSRFRLWVILLQVSGADGEQATKAFLADPYMGRIQEYRSFGERGELPSPVPAEGTDSEESGRKGGDLPAGSIDEGRSDR